MISQKISQKYFKCGKYFEKISQKRKFKFYTATASWFHPSHTTCHILKITKAEEEYFFGSMISLYTSYKYEQILKTSLNVIPNSRAWEIFKSATILAWNEKQIKEKAGKVNFQRMKSRVMCKSE